MKMHTGEKQYHCSVCGQQFIQKCRLQKHNTVDIVEWLCGCGWCGEMFRCKAVLNQHTMLHTGDRDVCSVRGNVFTICPNLGSQVRTRTGEKPYFCHTCSVHFTQKEALTKHPTIHNNDRPHQCSVCNKRFITHSVFKFHYRIETGAKPYTGATCQNSFTYSGYFMQYLCYSVVKMALCVRSV